MNESSPNLLTQTQCVPFCPSLLLPSPSFAAPRTHLSSRQSSFPALHLPPPPQISGQKFSRSVLALLQAPPHHHHHHHSGLRAERKLARNSRPLSSRRSECARTKGEKHSYSMRRHEGDTCQKHANMQLMLMFTTHTHRENRLLSQGELCRQ